MVEEDGQIKKPKIREAGHHAGRLRVDHGVASNEATNPCQRGDEGHEPVPNPIAHRGFTVPATGETVVVELIHNLATEADDAFRQRPEFEAELALEHDGEIAVRATVLLGDAAHIKEDL